ncbi:MAG: glucose-6-phosphate isomerase [Armatimonadota bacterium]
MTPPINAQAISLTERLGSAIRTALDAMAEDDWIRRIWDQEAELWRSEPEHVTEIKRRLGWLHLPTRALPKAGMLEEFAGEARGQFDRVVLLGMGGSSLAAWCFADIFGPAEGYPELVVLDSTVPSEVLAATGEAPLERCLFIVASKSGTTSETRSLFDYFWERLCETKGDDAGENVIAITDPGTPLAELADRRGLRATFENWPDLGGRYSALSYFGMVPAALLGLPVRRILERASEMAAVCAPEVPADQNPGAALGALLSRAYEAGRDKVTFLTSERMATFGDWAEQLLAESTGKDLKGLVPVVGEPPVEVASYGTDRLFAYIRMGEDDVHDRLAAELAEAGHPVVRIDVNDSISVGAEMWRWEFATAVAGAVMGINPFDQPDVQAAKDRTKQMLETYRQSGALPEMTPDATDGDMAVYGAPGAAEIRHAVDRLLEQAQDGDYFAIMAYLPRRPVVDDAVARMRAEVAGGLGIATTFGYGPRFLHSTGQLHKGGANTGVFLQITGHDAQAVAVPGEPYDFETLKSAQAQGDFHVLQEKRRRAIRVDLGENIDANLGRLTEMIAEAVAD